LGDKGRVVKAPLLIGYFTVQLIVRNWISMSQIWLRAVLFAPLIIPVTLERSETHGAFIIFFGAEYKWTSDWSCLFNYFTCWI